VVLVLESFGAIEVTSSVLGEEEGGELMSDGLVAVISFLVVRAIFEEDDEEESSERAKSKSFWRNFLGSRDS
jgi:hypothetical protein